VTEVIFLCIHNAGRGWQLSAKTSPKCNCVSHLMRQDTGLVLAVRLDLTVYCDEQADSYTAGVATNGDRTTKEW